MLCVRLADDGTEGKFCRGQLITAMWEDLETRSKKLGSVAASLRNEQIQQTAHHFQVRSRSRSRGPDPADLPPLSGELLLGTGKDEFRRTA